MNRMRILALAALWTAAALAAAQSADDVVTTLRDRGIRPAKEQAARLAEKQPQDGVAWQILGILQAASGDPHAAEASFSKAIDLKGASARETGLEAIAPIGSPLYIGLRQLKPVFTLSAGPAAAYNNRAAARFLLGRLDEAFEDIDQAAATESDWGVPWLNGAIFNLERRRFDQAEKSARMALTLGERSSRAFATLADIEEQSERRDRAEDDLKQALEIDPFDPYALLVKARLSTVKGRSRDAERALVQALSAGPAVAADSKLVPSAGYGSVLGGSDSEAHLRLFQHGFSNERLGYRAWLQFDHELVEGRSNADQDLFYGEGVYSGAIGTAYALHRTSRGGRPGAERSIVGGGTQPGSRFRLTQTQALWLRPFPTSRDSTLWLHVAFRQADIDLRTGSSGSYRDTIFDRQLQGEARWDWRHSDQITTSIGGVMARLNRDGSGGRPVEPAEQVLSTGESRLWTAYLVHRRPLLPKVGLAVGLMAGGTKTGGQTNQQLQPVADLSFRVSQARTIHFRVTPRFNDAVSNLVPLDLVADTPQDNPIDRQFASTTMFNRNPILPGGRTRMIDFELALSDEERLERRFETVLFHRRMQDVNAQGADPRVATTLQLTAVRRGEATGIEERARFNLSDRLTLRLSAKLQETFADFAAQTLRGDAYPLAIPTDPGGMPDFPRFQAGARLDYAVGPWLAAVEVIHAGRRKVALPGTSGPNTVAYIFDAPEATTAHLFLYRRLGSNANLAFTVLNLAKANFYPGYPATTTFVVAYDYRF